MTRQEFIDQINIWDELLNFCYTVNCYVCDDIYSDGAMDDYINESLVDMARNCSWRELRQELDDLPDSDYFCLHNDYGEWVGVDDEFDTYKEDVLEWCDENSIWDEDEEEDEEEYIPEEPATPDDNDGDDEVPTDSASLFELFAACAGVKAAKTAVDAVESEPPSLTKLFA